MSSRPTAAVTRAPKGPGRPSALTPETTQSFVKAILGGNTVEDASRWAGISPATVMRWMALGRKQGRGEYRDFLEAAESARARAKIRLVTKVTAAAQTDAKMALEILSRRFPEEWARRQKIDVEDKGSDRKRKGVRDKVLAQLDRVEARLNQRAAFTTAAALAPDTPADET